MQVVLKVHSSFLIFIIVIHFDNRTVACILRTLSFSHSSLLWTWFAVCTLYTPYQRRQLATHVPHHRLSNPTYCTHRPNALRVCILTPIITAFQTLLFNRQCSFQALWLKTGRILAKPKTVMESRNGSAHFVFELLKKRRTLSGSSHKLLHAIAAIMSLFFAAGHSWECCSRPFEAICLGSGYEMANWPNLVSDEERLHQITHTWNRTKR